MKRRRVLVVEGDMSRASILTQMLKKEGLDHFWVTSTTSALEMAEYHEHFDVLLAGLSLPEKAGEHADPYAGYNLAIKIRQEIPDIKIVFHSTTIDVPTARGLLPTGLRAPVYFLPKQFLSRDLRKAINR